KLCPHGIFLPNRRRVYSEFSDRVFAILERYSPKVHVLSIDEGLVDLTGTDRLFGPPLKTADAIIRRIETEVGLPSSAGLSFGMEKSNRPWKFMMKIGCCNTRM